MNDRELLELAAKAAGIKILEHADDRSPVIKHGRGWRVWNPLSDDGDAMRLAVKLEIDLQHNWESVIAIYAPCKSVRQIIHCETIDCDDRHTATRRAIVRAAAEIGRTMEDK